MVPTPYHPFWVKTTSQQSISQKRPLSKIEIRPLSPLHQTTPSINPLIVGPPPLHWLGIGWWCSSNSVVVPLLCFFVFFLFPHCLCSTLSCSVPTSFLFVLTLTEDGMDLLGLPYLLGLL